MGRDDKRTELRKEEPEEQIEQQEGKAGGSSRLGKEAKIGVTAILLLLVIFGIVLAVRLTRSSADGQAVASAAPQRADKERPDDSATNDELFKGFRSRPSAGAGGPTVVSARAAPVAPPRTIDSNLDKWKMASDRAVGQVGNPPRKMSERMPELSVPLPTLPEPPKTAHGSRYERYASNPPLGRELGDPKPLRQPPDDTRLVLSSDEKRPRPPRAGALTPKPAPAERAERSGYASASADLPPPPRREEEKSRYERSAEIGPPSLPPDSSYAEVSDRPMPVTPVSRNGETNHRYRDNDFDRGDNTYRDNSAGFGGSDREPRRHPSYSSPPPRRDDGKYEVEPNDSYWTISEKVYGSSAYFKALYEHNRNQIGDDERLKPGALISTPSVAELEKSYPDLCPKSSRRETMQSRMTAVSTRQSYRSGRTYTVSEGDTLFNIARYELGKASRWVEIYELNRDLLGKDFNYLTPGMKLTLPDGEKSDTLAEPPSRGYRR